MLMIRDLKNFCKKMESVVDYPHKVLNVFINEANKTIRFRIKDLRNDEIIMHRFEMDTDEVTNTTLDNWVKE